MRSNYWDTWKGIAIISVIAIHVTGAALEFPTKSPNWYFGIILFQFFDFVVPLFLALAGYFAAKNSINHLSDVKKYWHARLVQILPPYLFWTIVSISLKSPSDFLSITVLDKDIILGGGIGIGYFVIVLVQYILITPLIMKIKRTSHHIIMMVAITCGALILNYSLRIHYPESVFAHFPYYALLFISWYPFYHLGIFIRQKEYVNKPSFSVQAPKFFIFYLLFVFASIFEGLIFASRGLMNIAVSQIRITTFLASTCLFLFSVAFYGVAATRTQKTIFSWLGRNSYPIYLMHLLFLPVIGSLLKHVLIVYGIQPFYILLQTVIVISICSFIIWVAKIIAPHMIQTRCIGI